MTNIVVITLFLAFFALALISPFLPFNLMWRTAFLSAGAFLAAHLLEQPVHWEDQNVGHSLGLAMILMFSSVVVVALTVRLLIVVSKGPLTQEVLGIGQYSDGRGWIDLRLFGAASQECCWLSALPVSLGVFMADMR